MTENSFTHLTPGHLLFDRYSIQKSLGQGGFGITYLAYDKKLDQEVCIKELFIAGNSTRSSNMSVQSQYTGSFSFRDFVERFLEEARKLARFQNPNIVRVLDIFEAHGTAYMVMEYLPGDNLKQRLEKVGKLSEPDAIRYMADLLNAVAAVHEKGMLHRDIKPENILITSDDRLVLIDFGAARDFDDGKTTTQTAMLTPGFAPPEQYSNRATRGAFTDVYALGATFYQLITGVKPIAATDRINEELVPPHLVNSSVSTGVSQVIMTSMDLKPELRFQSIESFKQALQSNGEKIVTKKKKTTAPPAGNSTTPKNRLKPVMFTFLGAVILGIALMLFEFESFVAGGIDSYSGNGLSGEMKACDNYEEIPIEWFDDGTCDCEDCSDESGIADVDSTQN
jgi:serine/threonine protein kinase